MTVILGDFEAAVQAKRMQRSYRGEDFVALAGALAVGKAVAKAMQRVEGLKVGVQARKKPLYLLKMEGKEKLTVISMHHRYYQE